MIQKLKELGAEIKVVKLSGLVQKRLASLY